MWEGPKRRIKLRLRLTTCCDRSSRGLLICGSTATFRVFDFPRIARDFSFGRSCQKSLRSKTKRWELSRDASCTSLTFQIRCNHESSGVPSERNRSHEFQLLVQK